MIGVGVKQSTSDLLIANCDEFIFYDDLVRNARPGVLRPDATARKASHDVRRRRKRRAAKR